MSKKNEETTELITIGDRVIAPEDITPSVYFDYIKGLKQKLDTDEYDHIVDGALQMMKKCKITGQVSMAKELAHSVELCLRELNAAKRGFDVFVNRKDIEAYIGKVEGKAIKLMELKHYPREIPDDQLDKIEKAQDIFDELYIAFTDYSLTETKKIAKARRDKDPVVFGAFFDKGDIESDSKTYVEDRMFFVADWVDEKCDLTFEELVRGMGKNKDREVTYKLTDPKDFEEVKAFINSQTQPVEELEPTSIFEKVKQAVKKKTTKKKEETKEVDAKYGLKKDGTPRKRPGRKKKSEE